ncbi:MAG: hypothetical protein NT091_04315 [Candidatus Falkowbacteria bacterium]|nr:hypothetical protein [Candidatus Falkowbacteria bacterium]
MKKTLEQSFRTMIDLQIFLVEERHEEGFALIVIGAINQLLSEGFFRMTDQLSFTSLFAIGQKLRTLQLEQSLMAFAIQHSEGCPIKAASNYIDGLKRHFEYSRKKAQELQRKEADRLKAEERKVENKLLQRQLAEQKLQRRQDQLQSKQVA